MSLPARPSPNLDSVTTIQEDGSRFFLHPADVRGPFTRYRRIFGALLLAVYLALQVSVGWVMGLLLVASGTCCLRRKARSFVSAASIVNLLHFPHGTTVAALVLHGLRRPAVADAFRER